MTSVKIGGIKYPIIKEKNLKDKKVPVWGMTKYEDSEIWVNKDLGIQKQNQTIIILLMVLNITDLILEKTN